MPDRFIEKNIAIRGLNIRVKYWHSDARQHVIALHGWLDNAASFDLLAPFLDEFSIAAIDLAGQGFSDHRPPSATYHLWDDLLDIFALADYLGWTTFSIIGHSRGAMLATMLAASFPERVQQIILLDGLLPVPVAIENAPQQLRQFLLDFTIPRHNRLFDTRDQAIAVRARASAIPETVAEILAQRQLRQSDAGWYWCIDERLKSASAFKLSAEHNKAFLEAMACPVTVILASKGLGADPAMQLVQLEYPQFNWHRLDGHHHLHLDTTSVQEVALLCRKSLFQTF